MVRCVFCGREESFHKGIHLITNEGTIQYYCSSKCRKNAIKFKKDKRAVRWTNAYRIARSGAIAKSEAAGNAATMTEKKK